MILYSGETTECVTVSCLTPIHLSKEGPIGVPDPIRQQRVKMFIMLKNGIEPPEEVRAELIE